MRHPGLLMLLLAACSSGPPDPRHDDSPTFGHVLVLADQDLRPVLEDQRTTFEALYEKARVDVRYLPERQLVQAMLNDSVRAVFGAFLPGADQQAYFRTRQLTPHVEAVAVEAIAVLAHPAGPDSLSLDEIRGILRDGRLGGRPCAALLDDAGSGVARSLVDSLWNGAADQALKVQVAHGPQDLVERLRRDSTAIGLLAFSLISDLDDPACRTLRDDLRLVPVHRGDGPALAPTQGTLKDGRYPLRRPLMMLVTEGKSGLGTGFASFVAGHKGQRILLKKGLAPAHVPARDVMIVTP
ncbi:MAG TPA: substrate-binding domain-containing protein [Flavobacteriales bacterium]|nr:substrate-binding domain-containing protein [Flavobacteriales bacterium]HMR28266.1 substrate-binding domain-containing protein [Flavobacteriales bacterium]